MLAYDDIMNKQRELIYRQRQDVLNGMDISEKVRGMITSTVTEKAYEFYDESAKTVDVGGLEAYFKQMLRGVYPEREIEKLGEQGKIEEIVELLLTTAEKLYYSKEEMLGIDNLKEAERNILLRIVDTKWIDHIDAMDDLKGSIGLQSYAQRDPVNEYRFRGADMFDELITDIRENMTRAVLSITKAEPQMVRVQVANPLIASASGEPPKKAKTIVKGKNRVERNDPCPCGSGKKYKKCCMLKDQQNRV